MFDELKRITAITGHYGCGKTNFAVNLALYLKREGKDHALVDLDIVNPYFRTSDFTEMLQKEGVDVVSPNFAGTLLDIPSLPREIDGLIASDRRVILDVGGDDAGAAALGHYASAIAEQGGASLIYLFSMFRPFTRTADDVKRHIAEIEAAARMKVTALVNSSNLGAGTSAEDIEASMAYAGEVSTATGLPLAATLVLEGIDAKTRDSFPVKRYVILPWESK